MDGASVGTAKGAPAVQFIFQDPPYAVSSWAGPPPPPLQALAVGGVLGHRGVTGGVTGGSQGWTKLGSQGGHRANTLGLPVSW